MKAWAKSLDADKSSGIRFLADPAGEFSKAWDVTFDATPILGNHRSKRYAVTLENGKVVKTAVEPDNTGLSSKSYPTRLVRKMQMQIGLTPSSLRRRQALVNIRKLFRMLNPLHAYNRPTSLTLLPVPP